MTEPISPAPSFIAEVSSNHHQELDRCLAFIDCAAAVGCDAVKFQLFRIDELFAPEILAVSEAHCSRRAWELPVDFLPALKQRCIEKGLLFSCTPFYLDAVNELAPYVDFFKVASYELLWDELLQACAEVGKPVVLSTGMATLEEIDHAVEVIRDAGCLDLTLLHCVSAYPTPPEQCNLAVLEDLRHRYACRVGWSDHTVSPPVIQRAIHRFSAEMIEFHLDLDGEGGEYAAGHCWLPWQIERVIGDLRTALTADGIPQKGVTEGEAGDRDWRADPADGLRPLRKARQAFMKAELERE